MKFFHKLLRMQHHKLHRMQHHKLRKRQHHKLQRVRHHKLKIIQSRNMETRIDFLQFLGKDVCFHIMSFLDDPADIVRASAVSRSWHQFLIANEFAKRACLKRIPGVTNIVGTSITMYKSQWTVDSNKENEWEILERDQKVYGSLLLAITKSRVDDLQVTMYEAVSASSTDNYPDECILNTMHHRDSFGGVRASYWSSKGQDNPDVPETLIYTLSNGWVLTEIFIKPFEAFFQPGNPIYSAKYVRFRIGHPKSPREFKKYRYNLPLEEPVDDKFVWSYVSPEFPMVQNNRLQRFKLPEPVLCIDAYLQIELLGRVQRHEKDGLFYICVSYVQVLGRPMIPAFNIERTKPDRKLILKYNPKNLDDVLKTYFPSRTSYLVEDTRWENMNMVEEKLRRMIMQQECNDQSTSVESEEEDEEINGGFSWW